MSKIKKWNIGERCTDENAVFEISKSLGIEPVTARLLYQRGYTAPETAESFIKLESELFHDPFLMKDMERACERTAMALENGERMVIYGDYDVDGVTSVSVLYLFLKENGANIGYYIPNRAGEGYGVNKEAIKKLSDEGARLFITVDTGITASEEAEYAKTLGCDIIVTDHHECHGELPTAAAAVVNPKRPDCTYPFKELAGVGVAFKFITALEYTLRKRSGGSTEGFLEYVCRKYIDLVAIGTIADVMPLCDENRLIVSMGLSYINRSARVGVNALIEAADGGKNSKKGKATSSLIGFTVAPRINAAGRLGTATRAVELFLTESASEAALIAEELCEMNRKRQYEENKIIDEIKKRLEAEPSLGNDLVIVLDDENWHHGVIGIVASRVTERYSRPSILISFEGDIGKGSGRSVKGLNLVEALGSCSDLLVKFGGHELAAGLSVEKSKLCEFRRRINEYARECLDGKEPVADVDIDLEVYPEEITLRQAEELLLLEPFGVSNPVPLFAMRGVSIKDISPIGSGKHSKLTVEKNGMLFSCVCFGSSPEELGFAPEDEADIAFNLSVNEFRGNRSEQLLIRELRPVNAVIEKNRAAFSEYERIASGKCAPKPSELPVREDFVSVYLHLKRCTAEGEGDFNLHKLLYDLNSLPSQSGALSYARLRLTLDILSESGIISLSEKDTDISGMELFGISVNKLEKKVNLEKSCLYQQLTAQAKTSMPE